MALYPSGVSNLYRAGLLHQHASPVSLLLHACSCHTSCLGQYTPAGHASWCFRFGGKSLGELHTWWLQKVLYKYAEVTVGCGFCVHGSCAKPLLGSPSDVPVLRLAGRCDGPCCAPRYACMLLSRSFWAVHQTHMAAGRKVTALGRGFW